MDGLSDKGNCELARLAGEVDVGFVGLLHMHTRYPAN